MLRGPHRDRRVDRRARRNLRDGEQARSNPGGAATDWWFEYGTSTSVRLDDGDGERQASGLPTNISPSRSPSAGVGSGDDLPLPGRRPRTAFGHRSTVVTGSSRPLRPRLQSRPPASGVGPTGATLGGNGRTRTANPRSGTWSTAPRRRTARRPRRSDAGVRAPRRRRSRPVSAGWPPARRTLPARCRRELGRDGSRARMRPSSPPSRRWRRPLPRAPLGSTSAKPERQGRPEREDDDIPSSSTGSTTAYGTKSSSSSAGSGLGATTRLEDGDRPQVRRHLPLSGSSRRVTRAPSTGSDQSVHDT